jgi:hypothetical protein
MPSSAPPDAGWARETSQRFADLEREWQRVHDGETARLDALVEDWRSAITDLDAQQRRLQEDGQWVRGPADLMAVLHLAHDEVKNCRALAWLLDPLAPHGLGTAFLSRFLTRIKMGNGDRFNDLGRATVVVEETRIDPLSLVPTRADVIVYGPGLPPAWTVLIEAKVYAPEQPDQGGRLERAWAENDPSTVFLTRHGRVMTTGGDAWVPLRWRDLADDLRACLGEGNPAAAGRPAVHEYLRAMEAHLR